MDLTNLRDSLDSTSRHSASTSSKENEQRLTKDFKAAALHLTTLYRNSLVRSKRSYAEGYVQSLCDIMDVVQLRICQDTSSNLRERRRTDTGADDLQWLAKYLKARLEAIHSEHEDEDEKEETEDDEADTRRSSTPSACRDQDNEAEKHDMSGNQIHTSSVDADHALSCEAERKDTVNSTEQTVPPFTFTVPPSAGTLAPLVKARRGRHALSQPATVAMSPNHPTNVARPSTMRTASSSDEESHSHTTSRRQSRLGKRSGRERLDMRTIQAKRRRFLGDTFDNDRSDTI